MINSTQIYPQYTIDREQVCVGDPCEKHKVEHFFTISDTDPERIKVAKRIFERCVHPCQPEYMNPVERGRIKTEYEEEFKQLEHLKEQIIIEKGGEEGEAMRYYVEVERPRLERVTEPFRKKLNAGHPYPISLTERCWSILAWPIRTIERLSDEFDEWVKKKLEEYPILGFVAIILLATAVFFTYSTRVALFVLSTAVLIPTAIWITL